MENFTLAIEAFFKLPTGLFLVILFSIPFSIIGIYFIAEKLWRFLKKK